MEENLKKVGNFILYNIEAKYPYFYAKDSTTEKIYIYRELTKEEKKEKNIERFSDISNKNVLSFKKEKNYIFWEFYGGGILQQFKNYSMFHHILNEIHIQKIALQIIDGIESLAKKDKIYGGISLDRIFLKFEEKI